MLSYQDYLTGKVETQDQSRSAKDFSFACFLAKKGLLFSEIYVLIRDTQNTYNKHKKLTHKYLTRTIQKAMDTLQATRGGSRELPTAIEPPIAEDEALAGFSKGAEERRVSSPSVLPGLLSWSELKDIELPEVEVIPTPIPRLNTYLAGGFGIGELAFLIAKQESGKSSLSCALAAHAVKLGYTALVVHYEDTFLSLQKRYSTLLGDHKELSEVYFVNAVQYKPNLETIRKAIQQVKPALVVVDYFSRIPVPASSKGAESRFEAKHITEILKDMAVETQCAMIVTDHVTIIPPKAGNPYRIRDFMVAESKMFKLALVDTMIGLARDHDNGEKIYLTGMKFKRKYTRGMFASFQVDWERCRFWE